MGSALKDGKQKVKWRSEKMGKMVTFGAQHRYNNTLSNAHVTRTLTPGILPSRSSCGSRLISQGLVSVGSSTV